MNNKTVKLIAIIMCAVLIPTAFSACKLTDPSKENLSEELFGLKIAMSSKNADITMYDILQSYYNNDYYQYYIYGFISQDDYINLIVNDMTTFMYIVNAAYDEGFEPTGEEYEEIVKNATDQFEQLLTRYESQVSADAADKRSEAIKLFEADVALYGVDFDSAFELTVKSMCMYKAAEKYYNSITTGVEVADADVERYYRDQFDDQINNTAADFAELMTEYCYGGGYPYPVYIPEDCFSVNHIYLELKDVSATGQTPVYDKESRRNDEQEIEAKLPETDGFEGFMALVDEYGEDPGMEHDEYRENGYVIHPSVDGNYFPGFVYAAMNLHDGDWTPAEDAGYETPELTFFELKDGTRVVKVYTESGVHYLIVNKEYKKGMVKYEKGDAKWESWKSAVSNSASEAKFEELYYSWQSKYNIDVDLDSIKAIVSKNKGSQS